MTPTEPCKSCEESASGVCTRHNGVAQRQDKPSPREEPWQALKRIYDRHHDASFTNWPAIAKKFSLWLAAQQQPSQGTRTIREALELMVKELSSYASKNGLGPAQLQYALSQGERALAAQQPMASEQLAWRAEGYVCAALHRVPIAGCRDCDAATITMTSGPKVANALAKAGLLGNVSIPQVIRVVESALGEPEPKPDPGGQR